MPEVLANKIAAGEVVQRPASVVKELVENAIDAGASTVEVIVKSSGKDLIQVIDDGSGMSERDAVMCFQRHATSKIRAIDDLERIRTLGFRGEALASIAAVSRVELRTKRKADEMGTQVRVEGGKLEAPAPCPATDGTSVAVRNLFFNVPARRNFLKTAATELKHIVETVQFLALANPALSFLLQHDGNELLNASGARSADAVETRIRDLFGPEVAEALVSVEETTSYLTLTGYVGEPSIGRRNSSDQYLLVNGRVVRSRYLNHAVKTAFGNSLPDSTYPFFVLYLDLDPQHVDVNVHPTKAEIKFDDEGGVYGFVKAVVKRALGLADLIPQIDDTADEYGLMPSVFTQLDRGLGPNRRGGEYPDQRLPREAPSGMPALWQDPYYGSEDEDPNVARLPRSSSEVDESPKVWQIDNRYVVMPLRSGLLLVDQYAAHQRVLYEKALASLASRKGYTQQLLFPETLEFPPGDFDLLCELMSQLRALGFEIEEFGGRSVIVRGIPADLKESTTPHILRDLIEEYRLMTKVGQLERDERLARSVARRGAIPHGVRMRAHEMAALVDQLFLCESPYSCPAGHPTMIRIGVDELATRFGRG
ncbi:MAG: DNA mismatch repair endonuclease MutL [Rhodothermia bacterium]|nr:DNA mismatch repair endonuclease MutL [Rhodothermia bacterium]